VKLMGNNFSQVKLSNNIFYVDGGAKLLDADIMGDSSVLHLLGNNYYAANGAASFAWGGNTYSSLSTWKAAATSQERRGVFSYGWQGNPNLTAPGSVNTIGLAQLQQLPLYLSAYRLQQNSLALDAGLNMNANFGSFIGTRDIFGDAPLYGASQDAGAHECNDCYMILPQNNITFDARRQANGVAINWRLKDESLVERYTVQFSDDGYGFKDLITTQATTYSAHDPVYFVHERFYRLQVIQKNGTSIYSRVVTVRNDANGFDIMVNESKIIFTSDAEQMVMLEIFGASGTLLHKQMMQVSKGTSTHYLNAQLPAGVYMIKAVTSKGSFRTIKIAR